MSGHKCRRLASLAYFCAYAGRTSPRPGHRTGLPRVRSRQARTVAEDEKVRLASRKGPQSAEGSRNSSPETTRFWVCCLYVLMVYSGVAMSLRFLLLLYSIFGHFVSVIYLPLVLRKSLYC